MKSLEVQTEFIDNLLDFSFDIGEEDDNVGNNRAKTLKSDPFLLSSHGDKTSDDVAAEEEELEWISNKDAFPKLESFVDMIPENPNDKSPVSVLDGAVNTTTNVKVPVRPRTKKRKRRTEQWRYYCLVPHEEPSKKKNKKKTTSKSRKPIASCLSLSTLARKCQHCQTEETPQWRAGPTGPKTLCNACGVRYKSGRLVPEYRPANSPTFSVELHSNSHRKVMEMRRQKNVDS